MKKKNKKIKRLRKILQLTMMLLLVVITIKIVSCATPKEYEYIIDGKPGISKECYQTEQIECYCLVDGSYTKVANYYKK